MADNEIETTDAIETTENDTTETSETETKGTGINYSKVVLRNNLGGVDAEATIALIESELLAWIEENEMDTDSIAAAVQAVYDKMPPAKIQMLDLNSLANRATQILNVPVGSDSRVANRVKEYIRGESKRFKESNGEEGAFMLQIGKGGGIFRSSPAVVKQYRERLAKKAAKNA